MVVEGQEKREVRRGGEAAAEDKSGINDCAKRAPSPPAHQVWRSFLGMKHLAGGSSLRKSTGRS